MKVLIAEDDAISRAMLERTLKRAGYEVTAVENGGEALAALWEEDPPRMALLDWMMPVKDGVEVCRDIRRRSEKTYTYLILLSSKESKKDIVEGLESGADDYLTKPCDPEELKARLRAGERILQLEDKLVEARESMRYQATHDRLTSLLNRGVIVELLMREIGRSQREKNCTVVMMIDIDHFKTVNDQHGHATGDEVLREVSRRLQNSVRSYDMVGRYGGEEFLVVLNKCEPSHAFVRAEHIRRSIGARNVKTQAGDLKVTVSIGLALTSKFPGLDADGIMHRADMALYEAKHGGRNCVKEAHIQPAEAPVGTETAVVPALLVKP